MPAWRHSLFALALATRQYPNFSLWASMQNNPQAEQLYLKALQQCWLFHADKFNHVDLIALFEQLEPHLPEDLESGNEGDAFAYDCGVILEAALESVPLNAKYARDASTACMASAIRFCELRYPEVQLDEEEQLLDFAEINHELEFQVNLLLKVLEPRSLQNIRELFEMAIDEHVSNIGLENPLTAANFPELFDPRLDLQVEQLNKTALAHEEAKAAQEAQEKAQAKARAHAQRVAARNRSAAAASADAATAAADAETEEEIPLYPEELALELSAAGLDFIPVLSAESEDGVNAINPYQNSPRHGAHAHKHKSKEHGQYKDKGHHAHKVGHSKDKAKGKDKGKKTKLTTN